LRAERENSSEALLGFYQKLHIVDGGIAIQGKREIERGTISTSEALARAG
jgi:hypothetical protein